MSHPKMNSSPLKAMMGLEDDVWLPFGVGKAYFQGRTVNFLGCISHVEEVETETTRHLVILVDSKLKK